MMRGGGHYIDAWVFVVYIRVSLCLLAVPRDEKNLEEHKSVQITGAAFDSMKHDCFWMLSPLKSRALKCPD